MTLRNADQFLATKWQPNMCAVLCVEAMYSWLSRYNPCRLLRWGSSTIADLATSTSAKLDQTWPGLEMGWAQNEQTPEQLQAEGLIDIGTLTASGVKQQSSSVSRHWPSSSHNGLPGGFSDSEAASTSGPKHSHLEGLRSHSAVECSGSSIPMLLDDSGAPCAMPQALQPEAVGSSEAIGTQLPAQRDCMPEAANALSGQATDLSHLLNPFQPSSPQPQQASPPHGTQLRPPDWDPVSPQTDAPVLAEADSHSVSGQPQQVLRRRNRSRLRLTQGGVAKGLMSLGKHRSGRISPEKAALLPLKQKESFSRQCSHVDTDIPNCETNAADLTRHMKLSTAGLEAVVPNKSKSAAQVIAARHAARQRSSMHEVLQSSLQQVQACTAQLQAQNAQQQQLQRAVKAMTAATAAMLDKAILAAVHAQQQNDALQHS